MDAVETMAADLWATGVTPDGYPTELLRSRLDALGVVPASSLAAGEHGSRVRVAGVVTHRQRPATAGGTTFLNLEDETGLINVICSKGVWARYRSAAQGASALLIRGRLEKTITGAEVRSLAAAGGTGRSPSGGTAGGTVVVNIVADRIDPLAMELRPRSSRDFR
jgi:error-prone DNA polymerase